MSAKRTAIITGAQQGIGAGLVEGFLNAGYNVVGTSLHATQSLTASPNLVLVDGISVSRRPLSKLSKQRSSTSERSMFW